MAPTMDDVHKGYKVAAGEPKNDFILFHRRNERTAPPKSTPEIPNFPLDADKRPVLAAHSGWNPVYWSDYPKQPAWTVPMPKMAGPIVSERPYRNQILPCHERPLEHMTCRSCPSWMPEPPPFTPDFNPYVDETNLAFIELRGPPYLGRNVKGFVKL